MRDVVEWAADGDVEVDESAAWYVPSIPLEKPALISAIRERGLRSVSAVFAQLAPDGEDAGSKMALASLLKTLWGREYIDERDARFINDRVHANIQRDDTFSVVPQIAGGVTTADQLRRIADVAGQVPGPDDQDHRWAADRPAQRAQGGPARGLGRPGHALGLRLRQVVPHGEDLRGLRLLPVRAGDSTALGVDIEKHYQGLDSPAKMKLAVAGCPRNCSEALVKDIGLVAVGSDETGDRWEIYIGGAAGASVRKGDVLATVTGRAEALRLCGTFMQYYRGERALAGAHLRLRAPGRDRCAAGVAGGRPGRCRGRAGRAHAGLGGRLRRSLVGGREPRTSAQFADALPLIPLPQVPIRRDAEPQERSA